MTSIRRTLSSGHLDRPYQNGLGSFSVSSTSHKFTPSAKHSSPFISLVACTIGLLRFLCGRRYTRKGQWKKALYWFFLFFLVGFLLGMFPFGNVADETIHRQALEIKPLHSNAPWGPHDPRVLKKENDIVVDPVALKVDKEVEVNRRLEIVPRKQLIIVTPTYNRSFQAYFLNRLGHTLRLVPPPILWIVVEMNSASTETAEILRKMGIVHRHLVCAKNSANPKDRGVHQRNTALEHIELHKLDGIVYFADDDNIYTLELFDTLRDISRFGTWPVAMLAQGKNKVILEGPVCNGSQIMGWHTNEKSKRLRRFHVDMSGFAFNSRILWDPKRSGILNTKPIRQLDTVKEGFQETTFIEQLVEDEGNIEGSPAGCSKLMNWHLHLEGQNAVYPRSWILKKNLDEVIQIVR